MNKSLPPFQTLSVGNVIPVGIDFKVAITQNRRTFYMMVGEENTQFIFRDVENVRFGHSGAWGTRSDCIRHAILVGNASVLLFENYVDAFTYINMVKTARGDA